MPLFTKRPVTIEARRVPVCADVPSIVDYCDQGIALADWCGGVSFMMVEDDEHAFHGNEHAELPGPHILIRTLEGEMRADPGDWIIRGVKGEFYPCKPDIFETTYNPA